MRHRPALLVRLTLALLALGIIVWAAVLARDARLQTNALARVHAHPGPAAFRASTRMLRRATLWSANPEPKVYLAGLELLLGRAPAALKLAEQVTRSEPDNIDAWGVIALAGARVAPAQARRARARIAALDPLSARR